MAKKEPYRFWGRLELQSHLERQAKAFKAEHLIDEINRAVWNDDWNPIADYNGCNLVQDVYHPYVPCFIHDYHWVVMGGGIEYDRQFIKNLRHFGMKKFKSRLWFIGVRLGWLLYYKWKNA